MKWEEIKRTIMTPPPSQPPPPKEPLFTKDPFSTTSFGPGHLVGAVSLVGGLFLLMRYFVRRGESQAEAFRRTTAQTTPIPAGAPLPASASSRPTQDQASVAQAENARGQYGSRR